MENKDEDVSYNLDEHGTHKQILNDTKLACNIVSSAIAGVIRRSMGNANSFHEQCYKLLQVDNTKEAEREINKRLQNILAGKAGTPNKSHNPSPISAGKPQEDSSLDEKEQCTFKDDWLDQARADAEEWL